jgi:hypothetical protein
MGCEEVLIFGKEANLDGIEASSIAILFFGAKN